MNVSEYTWNALSQIITIITGGTITDRMWCLAGGERLVNTDTTGIHLNLGARPNATLKLERWADDVDTEDLVEADTSVLRTIAELIERRQEVGGSRGHHVEAH